LREVPRLPWTSLTPKTSVTRWKLERLTQDANHTNFSRKSHLRHSWSLITGSHLHQGLPSAHPCCRGRSDGPRLQGFSWQFPRKWSQGSHPHHVEPMR